MQFGNDESKMKRDVSVQGSSIEHMKMRMDASVQGTIDNYVDQSGQYSRLQS